MVDPMKVPGIDAKRLQVNALEARPARVQPQAGEDKSFTDVLAEAVTEVQKLQNEADTTIKKLVAGEIKDVSEAMVAVQKADMSFRTMMTVRNKVVTAYEEIMRMQI